jgi:hypothetical protein
MSGGSVPFGRVFDQPIPHGTIKGWLRSLTLRLFPPRDPRLKGLKADQAPKTMDRYQAMAWASQYRFNLVEAGAGAGKTFLVVQRAKLLLAKGVLPETIAFMTFTKAATAELKERLTNELGLEVADRILVCTIHQFAKKIARNLGLPSNYHIFNATDPKDVYREAWKKVLRADLKSHGAQASAEALQAWLLEEDMLREGLPFEHIYPELHGEPQISTALGIKVRSKGEKKILEEFEKQGIKAEYEQLFLGGKFPFRPDFFLPVAGIYVEYLGMWEHEDPDVREGYRACLKNKRFEFKRLGLESCYVEIYPSDLRDGTWIDKVRRSMPKGNPSEIGKLQGEVLERVREREDLVVELAISLSNVLLKFESRMKAPPQYPRQVRSLLELVKRLHGIVIDELMLHDNHEADSFISALAAYIQASPELATKGLEPLEYIFCDEFQDVYPALFAMLQHIFRAGNVVCIGDSRQAIYGFTGGTPAFMRNFARLVPGTRRFRLPVNRRSTSKIIEISEAVLPVGSLRAEAVTIAKDGVVKIAVPDEEVAAGDLVNWACTFGGSKDVLVLTRYNPKTSKIAARYHNEAKGLGARSHSFHGSKGLEADTVLVAGLVHKMKGPWNVPPTRQDHPVVDTVKKINGAQTVEQQEICLLYVALSRAKKKMILVTHPTNAAPLARPALEIAETRAAGHDAS